MKRGKPKLKLMNGRWKVDRERGIVYRPRDMARASAHCRELNEQREGAVR